MQPLKITTLVVAGLAMCLSAGADIISINTLDIRSGGVFGHDAALGTPVAQQGGNGLVLLNGAAPPNVNTAANPLDVTIIYGGLDLDGDASANDTVTFTLRYTGTGNNPNAMNQGIDTGFGSLNGLTLSMLSVSGTATDSGDPIVFDGFTSVNVAMGSTPANTRNVDVTGLGQPTVTANLATTGGSFQFVQQSIDWTTPVASVLFDNSGGTGGSIVARNYDLQFSTIPEPSTLALLGLAGGLLAWRRRK